MNSQFIILFYYKMKLSIYNFVLLQDAVFFAIETVFGIAPHVYGYSFYAECRLSG